MSRSLFVTFGNAWIYTRLLHLILCCEVIFWNRIRLKSRKHEQGNLNFDTVGEMNKIELTAWAFWYKTEKKSCILTGNPLYYHNFYVREYLHVVYLRNYTILICSECYKKQALVNSRQISLYLKDNLYCKRMSIFLINYTSVTLVSLNGYQQRLPFCERRREKIPHLQSRRSSSRK